MLKQLQFLLDQQRKPYLEELICLSESDDLKELWTLSIQSEDFMPPQENEVEAHLEKLNEFYHLPTLQKLSDFSHLAPLPSLSPHSTEDLYLQRRQQLLAYQKTPKPKFFGLRMTQNRK
jgi:hypothetical protein